MVMLDMNIPKRMPPKRDKDTNKYTSSSLIYPLQSISVVVEEASVEPKGSKQWFSGASEQSPE